MRKTIAVVALVLVALALQACGSSDKKSSSSTQSSGAASSGLTSKFHDQYIAGCTRAQSQEACQCIYTQLTEKQGVNSPAKLLAVSNRVKTAVTSGNVKAVPAEFRNAVLACKSLVRRKTG